MEPNDDNESVNEIRESPGREKPFCWQSKVALELLRNSSDEKGDVAHAMAVYLALTEISCERVSPTFDARISTIAERAGVSYRKTFDLLKRFAEVGVLNISSNKLAGTNCQAPSTYSLLKVRHSMPNPSCTPCKTLCTDTQQPSVPRVQIEDSRRGKKTKRHDTVIPIPDGYSETAKAVIQLWHEVAVGAGLNFLPVDKFTDAVEKAADPFSDHDEARELFEWCVARERENPSRLRKTIVRVLNDVVTGEGFFAEFPRGENSQLDEEETPF